MNICKNLTTMAFVSSQNWRKVTLTWIPDLVQSPTNENPVINLENGLLSEQSKNNSRKSSPSTAQYLKVKNIFTLPGNPDKAHGFLFVS